MASASFELLGVRLENDEPDEREEIAGGPDSRVDRVQKKVL